MNKPEKLEFIRFGEIRPEGWIKEQMVRDLRGFTGHLDELVPALILEDDIYGKNRLTRRDKTKDVGNIRENADWEVQYLWWNSETQSNWRDGQIRQAILTEDPGQLEKVNDYLDHILATQDSNGYMGIYDRNLRYRFKGENGELWAKATLLRGLLAVYESGTGNRKDLLEVIERAVGEVMTSWPAGQSDPFRADKTFAGICHGLAFTDILDRLHQLTGKKEYLSYAVFLYRNYSANKLMEEDVRLHNILDPNYKLKGHGVHTFEHLRSLAVAYYSTGDPELKRALDIYLRRIDSLICPSGGPIGDEWIGGRKADASKAGYEYCSLQELLDAYTLLLQKTGKAVFADKVERLFFNAAQGARHPIESSIAYLKSDNSLSMTGALNDTAVGSRQTRYKYSPTHQDVAVCCVPNAGRIASYFVKSMWMRDKDGLVAALYGPSRLTTEIRGTKINIRQETDYPNEFKILFTVVPEFPARFTLKFRKPAWTSGFKINQDYRESRNFIMVTRTWKTGDEILLEFNPEVRFNTTYNNEVYFTYGPLVLARPIDGEPIEVRKYPLEGFRDLHIKPVNPEWFRMGQDSTAEQVGTGRLTFKTSLINEKRGKIQSVELVPMGQTILRQVTFRKSK